MKRHYIYFSLLPVVLFLVFSLPFTIEFSYRGMLERVNNSFDDGFTWIVYTIPTLVATILLLIRNKVTAIIGSSVYLLSFGLSILMIYLLHFKSGRDQVGVGAYSILVVMLGATILGILHTIKLFKNRRLKVNENHRVIDDFV